MTATITVTDTKGDSRQVDLVVGLSLMELLRDEGYEEILAMCGGSCSCATCHVHITPQTGIPLPAVEEDEEMLLELADHYVPEQSRLSCQITLAAEHAGLQVNILQPE